MGNPDSIVTEKMKSTPLMFKCVTLGLSCLIQKMEIVPPYPPEGGKLNQILNKTANDLKICQWPLPAETIKSQLLE